MSKMKYPQIALKIDAELQERLRAEAERLNVSMSRLARACLVFGLNTSNIGNVEGNIMFRRKPGLRNSAYLFKQA